MNTSVQIIFRRPEQRELAWERRAVRRNQLQIQKWWTRRFTALGCALIVASFALASLDPAAFPTLGLTRALCAVAGVATVFFAWIR